MTTYVLVHGAWGGSYGFRSVRPLLQAEGHQVFTPSLTGIGERSHLTSPTVGLSTHVLDVVNAIRYEDLTDIVLLGFSYGGMVVTGALDHIGDRVRHLIYLDAIVPADGMSAVDVMGLGLGDAGAPDESVDPGSSWLVPPRPRPLGDPVLTAWSEARRSHQPARTLTEAVQLSKPLETWPMPLTYIKASADPDEDPDSAFWKMARIAEASERWSYREIATNHMVPMTRPEEFVAILLALSD